tara:strand:- start:88 stop:543 length:456 start_codon:yes stop_codon:yes gene_type:complete
MINYNTVLTDMKALVEASSAVYDPADTEKVKTVFIEMNDRDMVTYNCPLLDLRVKSADPEPTTNTAYYVEMIIEAEIAVFHLTTRLKAATIRNSLVQALQTLIRENPRFSGSLDTSIVGEVEFATGETDDTQGAFVAGAVMNIKCFLYSDR